METKSCPKCGLEKELHLFWRRNDGRGGGYQSWCIECLNARRRKSSSEYMRAHNLMEKFCMTIPEYELILKSQDGLCKICKKAFDYYLSVDHNHLTGKIRGLLCKPCNTLLGNCKDDILILESAILYLRGAV